MKTREELDNLGQKILNECRTELYLSMRFMGVALNSLDYRMDLSTRRVGTDAAFIRFNPNYLSQLYLERPEKLNRTYMHLLMHCLFRHMFSAKEHEDIELWDLSCDIAAESVVDSMDYPCIWQVTSDFRQEWYDKLKQDLKVLTAEKIYHYFITKKRDPYLEEALRQEFALCDHSFWERMPEEPPEDKGQDQPEMENPNPQLPNEQEQENDPEDSKDVYLDKPQDFEEKKKEWEEHSKRIQTDLETFSKEAAKDSGSLLHFLALENRKRTSYKEFLKKFSVIREETKIDMDSFDYNFYMYGLSMYGNMPLIEENEYRESKKIEELVIAIDTSASCQRGLVQEFLNETGAIFGNQENFFDKINIHIIECDNQVQNDIRITKLEDLKQYAEHFAVKGGYGTDFRPVFSYVEELRRKGILTNLKGLMYFTDGIGTYPKNATSYDTAFVFWTEEEFREEDVPDWAIKLYL